MIIHNYYLSICSQFKTFHLKGWNYINSNCVKHKYHPLWLLLVTDLLREVESCSLEVVGTGSLSFSNEGFQTHDLLYYQASGLLFVECNLFVDLCLYCWLGRKAKVCWRWKAWPQREPFQWECCQGGSRLCRVVSLLNLLCLPSSQVAV